MLNHQALRRSRSLDLHPAHFPNQIAGPGETRRPWHAYSRMVLWSAFFIAVWAGSSQPANAREPRTIGPHGATQELDIFGCQQIHPDQIRAGLERDTVYLLATRSSTLWPIWKSVTEDQITLGLQAAGFRDSRVEVHWSEVDRRPVIQIEEGTCYFNGPVTITGLEANAAEKLSGFLTSPPNSNTHPVSQAVDKQRSRPTWDIGQPTRFDRHGLDRLTKVIELGLAEQGLFKPRFRYTIATRPPEEGSDRHTAHLSLEITQTGPPGRLKQIEVEGLKEHSQQQILELAGLQLEQELTATQIREAARRLTDCGRFWNVQLNRHALPDSDQGIGLRISVVELPHAPPLNAELTDKQRTLQQLAAWINQLADGDDEVVIELSQTPPGSSKATFFLSPHNGWLIQFEGRLGGWHFDHALRISDTQTALYSPGRGVSFSARQLAFKPNIQVHMLPSRNPKTGEWKTAMTFGASIGSSPTKPSADSRAAAVCLMRESIIHGDDWQFEGDKLVLNTEHAHCVVDSTTGRPEQLQIQTDEADSWTFSLRTTPGALDARLAELEQLCPRESRQESALGFLIEEAAAARSAAPHSVTITADARRILAKLVQPVDARLDQEFMTPKATHEYRFFIPRPDVKPAGRASDFPAIPGHIIAAGLFPAGSWPWTLVRELGFAYSGRPDGAAEWQRVIRNSEQAGPIGHAVIAKLIDKLNPATANRIRQRGLNQLDSTGVARDFRLLLLERSAFSNAAEEIAQALRNLDDADYETLRNGLPDDWQPVLVNLRTQLKQARSDQIREATIQALADSSVTSIARVARQMLLPERTAEATDDTRRQ